MSNTKVMFSEKEINLMLKSEIILAFNECNKVEKLLPKYFNEIVNDFKS